MVPELHRQRLDVVLRALDVAAGLGVARLGERRQALDHHRLRALELLRAQLDRLFEAAPVEAELEVIAHAGAHELGVDRLADVVDRAMRKPDRFVFGIAEGGQEQDRDLPGRLVRLEAVADLVAVHSRHHDVEQDQVGTRLLDDRERGGAALRDQDPRPEPFDGFAQDLQVA